jgi:hypothetical protein
MWITFTLCSCFPHHLPVTFFYCIIRKEPSAPAEPGLGFQWTGPWNNLAGWLLSECCETKWACKSQLKQPKPAWKGIPKKPTVNPRSVHLHTQFFFKKNMRQVYLAVDQLCQKNYQHCMLLLIWNSEPRIRPIYLCETQIKSQLTYQQKIQTKYE